MCDRISLATSIGLALLVCLVTTESVHAIDQVIRRSSKTPTRGKITAISKNFGTSEITIELAPEMEQFASREYREVYSRYKKLSDEALEHEALPLGYREIIKRYFEGIRPHRDELPERE